MPVKKSLATILLSSRALVVESLSLGAVLLAYWGTFVQTLPLVTRQQMESSSSVLPFKVENPSFVFDMRDVTLACQVLRIETGPASKEAPVQFIAPIKNDNGRVLSEAKNFTISYGAPINFDCGAEQVFQMERSGVPYYPPRIEIEILIQFKTLWFQRALASAGPFVATRIVDKYQWTEGTTVTVEPVQPLRK
jgi:hypothetical protein